MHGVDKVERGESQGSAEADERCYSLDELIAYVTKVTGVGKYELFAKRRRWAEVRARHLLWSLYRQFGRYGVVGVPSYPAIARIFGMTHGTVIYGVKKMAAEVAEHTPKKIDEVLLKGGK